MARDHDNPGTQGWVYGTFRRLFGRSLRVFFRRIEVEGAENLPPSGGGILIAWHPNAVIDGMLLAAECPRPLTIAGRHGVFRVPLFGWLMRKSSCEATTNELESLKAYCEAQPVAAS